MTASDYCGTMNSILFIAAWLFAIYLLFLTGYTIYEYKHLTNTCTAKYGEFGKNWSFEHTDYNSKDCAWFSLVDRIQGCNICRF